MKKTDEPCPDAVPGQKLVVGKPLGSQTFSAKLVVETVQQPAAILSPEACVLALPSFKNRAIWRLHLRDPFIRSGPRLEDCAAITAGRNIQMANNQARSTPWLEARAPTGDCRASS